VELEQFCGQLALENQILKKTRTAFFSGMAVLQLVLAKLDEAFETERHRFAFRRTSVCRRLALRFSCAAKPGQDEFPHSDFSGASASVLSASLANVSAY
jgi:hypothetical protein